MKKIIFRIRAADRNIFTEIKSGLKVVETRAATPKYRAIEKGDVLVFICSHARLEKKVVRVRIFKSIGAMTKVIPFRKIMPSVESILAMRKVYASYSGYREKIKKCGVVAFNI